MVCGNLDNWAKWTELFFIWKQTKLRLWLLYFFTRGLKNSECTWRYKSQAKSDAEQQHDGGKHTLQEKLACIADTMH